MSSEPLTEMKEEDYAVLKMMPGNDVCADCDQRKPDWGSPHLGILFCFQCSGKHRGLGTHISFVRSVTMDAWTDRQIELMKMGGNQQCRAFLTQHGVDCSTASIREKYDSPAARLYKQILLARVEGRPEPASIEEIPSHVPQEAVTIKRKMEGFGSAPPPKPKRRGVMAALCLACPIIAASLCLGWLFRHQHRRT